MSPGRPEIAASAPDERIASIDAIRGIALFGVLIVNLVTEFRISIFQQFVGASVAPSGLDGALERIVSLGFESKAFALFSLLFGVGLAIQYERLSRVGQPLYWLARRMLVLLAFGLIHLIFIWNGDILTEYAIAGLLVLPLLLLRPTELLVAALVFLAVYVIGPAIYRISWPTLAELRAHVASANTVYANGSLAEVWRFSLRELPLIVPLHLFVLPRTFALFAFGMFLWRTGFLQRASEVTLETGLVALVGIVAGGALTALDAGGALRGAYGPALSVLAPVVLALGYGAALLALAQMPVSGRMVSVFAPLGRMAFTNYLLQSIVFSFIFFGYGLGRFGRMSATGAFALGLAVYAGQVVLSAWWLRRYRYGPVEWLWRTLMYGAAQPMRRAVAAT